MLQKPFYSLSYKSVLNLEFKNAWEEHSSPSYMTTAIFLCWFFRLLFSFVRTQHTLPFSKPVMVTFYMKALNSPNHLEDHKWINPAPPERAGIFSSPKLLVNCKELPWRERTLIQMQAAWEALLLLCWVNCFSKNLTKEVAFCGFLCSYREKCQEWINKSADPKLPYCAISSTHLHRRVYSPLFLLPSPPAYCFPSGRKRWEDKFQFPLNAYLPRDCFNFD